MSYELQYIIFAIIGYLSGSVLYAKIWGYAFTGCDITLESEDKNPGTYNAFAVGGFWCGTLTIICELLKGFIPVFLCMRLVDVNAQNEYLMALVTVVPIIGHILPVFNKFKGGKGIAVTFGVLLGYLPDFRVVLLLAIVFIVFAVIIVIKPNFYKTMITYIVAAVVVPFIGFRLAVTIAYIAAAVIVCIRLLLSDEEKGSINISLIKWQIIGSKSSEKDSVADSSETADTSKEDMNS